MFRTFGFNDWKNPTREKRGTFKIHEKSKAHVSSMDKADNLVMVSNEKKLDNNRFISRANAEKLAATVRLYLLSLTLSLYLCKEICI